MLESIVIHDFAIIDHAEIDFKAGMSALTGETGAGKSILLDAIQLVLGDRADSDSVKAGCEKADISVSFNLAQQDTVRQWLREQELGDEDECLLRRVIQSSGRSKAFINGYPVPLGQMRVLGEMLVDLHGQHEHQSLQRPVVQQQLLDASLGDSTLLQQTQLHFQQWKTLHRRQQQVLNQSAHKQQRIDLLQLYTQELQQLDLQPGEIAALQEEASRLSHAGQLLESTASLVARLYESDDFNIQDQLSHCTQELDQLVPIDHSLGTSAELLKSALIQVKEAASELRAYQDRIDLDPGRLDWLNQRISHAQSLARKHHVDAEDLSNLRDQFEQELDELLLDEADLEKLEQQLDDASESYRQSAKMLSEQRQVTAAMLSQQITEVMQTLGMQGGRFEISVENDESNPPFTASGIDHIQFLVSANPGQPPKPLGKVASGGELSRISLAIQVILSESSRIPTLIFDEVDSGIGGGIAEIVGRKLRQIARDRQVFCVTHLPQVASQAHHHYQVSKIKTDQTTATQVRELDSEQRLEEIARMLGGMTITPQTRAHAQEMINSV